MIKRTNQKPIEPPQTALPLSACIAKTINLRSGQTIPGVSVFDHCIFVGLIARELVERLPDELRKSLFPKGSELVAAAHDVGKVSPTFQEKIHRALDHYTPNSLPELQGVNPDIEKNWGGHAGTSQASLDENQYGYIPKILGRHHGFSPLTPANVTDTKIGGATWQDRRLDLLRKLQEVLAVDFPVIHNQWQMEAISGLTTVADWIGSSQDQIDIKQVNSLATDAGFVKPSLRHSLSFEDIFGFAPRPAQSQLISHIHTPGVYVLEAPMGVGKTEAALYAAYQMMDRGLATGFYFALPTQLTSNKIHDRVTCFLERILDESSLQRNAILLHGSAWIYQLTMGEEAQPGNSWFNSTKRGMLAPFAVGTIDQALMAVMHVKHGFVRAFGLAGKVVILDEVHSYDSYTGTILDHLVKGLRELQCTVIILSATLTKERRKAILNLSEQQAPNDLYPLITALPKGNSLAEFAIEHTSSDQYSVSFKQKREDAAVEALARAESGQQVLWIENTVADAQRVYKEFCAKEVLTKTTHAPIEVGLLHSRFLKIHREENEKRWVRIFGKDGHEDRNRCGRILVGTQVLEQSLDIDADFLVTLVCPTDMLLQRIGRLWRHRETDSLRSKDAKREAWIVAPNLQDAIESPKASLKQTALVYSPYVLCRTIEVWQDLAHIELPMQIRPLVESTYQARQEKGIMARHLHELETKRDSLQRFALASLSSLGNTLPEKVATRYSEQNTCDVLLLQALAFKEDTLEIRLLDGSLHTLEKNAKAKDWKSWRKLAALLTQNTLSVPVHLAPTKIDRKNLSILDEYVYMGNEDDESIVRISLVDRTWQVTAIDHGSASEKFKLEYRSDMGYVHTPYKNKESQEDVW